jgi:flagellar protein FliS
LPENKNIKNYLEMKIKTASPIQLIIMLYDKAISSLETAINLIEKGEKKFDIINNNIIKAQEILSELMLALDFDKGKEIAQNLYKLYDYSIKQCIEGNIKKEPALLKNVIKILSQLREAWVAISNKPEIVKDQNKNNENSSFNVSL